MSLQSFLASVFAQPRSWLRSGIHRNRLEDEMEAELADHLENLTADLIRAGQSPDEGARNARVSVGAGAVYQEEMRASLMLEVCDERRAGLQYGCVSHDQRP